jgi:hypothetical protein
MGGSCAGAGDDRENHVFRLGQNSGRILHHEGGLRTPAVATSERWERRDGYRGIGIFARIDDGRCGTSRAAEFYFGVRADVGVFEDVLRTAVTACCLHGDLKVALRWRAGLPMINGGAEMVMGKLTVDS